MEKICPHFWRCSFCDSFQRLWFSIYRSQIISSGLNKALTGCTLLFLWTDIVSLRRPTLDVGKKWRDGNESSSDVEIRCLDEGNTFTLKALVTRVVSVIKTPQGQFLPCLSQLTFRYDVTSLLSLLWCHIPWPINVKASLSSFQ